jgi:hypothetical protein
MLLAPAAAMAGTPPAPTMIDGNPLNIWTDSFGGVQVNVEGAPASEWFPQNGGFDPNTGMSLPSQNGNVGFGLIAYDDQGNYAASFGKFIGGGLGTPESGPTLTPGDPATISTSWLLQIGSGAPVARVTQLLSYKDGDRQFESAYTVQNVGPNPINFRANVAGDLAVRGTDSGVGFLLGGPPKFMGGQNLAVGAAGGFVEETPWSAYESNTLSSVGSHASQSAVPGGFDNSISITDADNAAGVQWDTYVPGQTPLRPGEVATFNLGWRYVETLSLDPISAEKKTGDELKLTANVADLGGNPIGKQTLKYSVDGANPKTGSVETSSAGKATFAYVGGNHGPDTITAFIDTNGNDIRDENEQQAISTANWTGPEPPVIGESAGVRPVRGVVKIKLPAGTSLGKAKRLGLQGAATKFTRLTTATQVPVGSQLDTTRGTVNLLTAGSTFGSYQGGRFNKGIFKVTQKRKNPLTELSMMGGNLKGCNTGVPRGGAARKRGRRLFGNARGRFRTRGRNSSATVRGTQWQMTDSCAGTLTTVKTGSVIVRDFRLRKNRTVKAGHRYLAKAPKKKRRRH